MEFIEFHQQSERQRRSTWLAVGPWTHGIVAFYDRVPEVLKILRQCVLADMLSTSGTHRLCVPNPRTVKVLG